MPSDPQTTRPLYVTDDEREVAELKALLREWLAAEGNSKVDRAELVWKTEDALDG